MWGNKGSRKRGSNGLRTRVHRLLVTTGRSGAGAADGGVCVCVCVCVDVHIKRDGSQLFWHWLGVRPAKFYIFIFIFSFGKEGGREVYLKGLAVTSTLFTSPVFVEIPAFPLFVCLTHTTSHHTAHRIPPLFTTPCLIVSYVLNTFTAQSPHCCSLDHAVVNALVAHPPLLKLLHIYLTILRERGWEGD